MFNSLIKEGIARIYKEDLQSQLHFINVITKEVRHCDSNIVTNSEGVFIPNNDYMGLYFGNSITLPEFDCYNNEGECKWNSNIIFPIYDIMESVVGLVGYNPLAKMLDPPQRSYKITSSSLYNKKVHLFSRKGTLKKALEDNYIVLTDGVFDTLSLQECGINACSLLGSDLSREHLFYLNLIDKVYVAMDNDKAGLKLVGQLKRRHPNVSTIKFDIGKDIDDLLKSEYKAIFLQEFKKHKSLKLNTDLICKYKKFKHTSRLNYNTL